MKKISLKIIMIICGSLLAVYLVLAAFFSNHYFLNTNIGGKDFSGLKVSDVEKYFEGLVDDYELKIKDIDGNVIKINGSDIELKYEGSKEAKEIMKSQNMFKWPVSFFKKNNVDADIGVSYNEEKLNSILENLDIVTAEQKPPVSAYPAYKDTKVVVVPEEKGNTIKKDVFYEVVGNYIKSFKPELVLEDEECYEVPEFTKDSEVIIKLAEDMNSFLGAKITYKMTEDEVIDGAVITSWLDYDEDYNVYLNEKAIEDWLTDFGDKYDTVGVERTIVNPYGEEKTVSGGTYGWSINEIAELPLIIEHINNKDVIEKEPVYYQKAAAHDEKDWGTTYVEVDLTNQVTWYIEDGSVVFESDVVTGLPIPSKVTTSGVFDILEMNRNKTLVGDKDPETGKPEYETPVSFWMRVTWSGIGFHDATWQPAFGGNCYTYNGSHGCINMPYSKAEELYGLISVGTPVIVHY